MATWKVEPTWKKSVIERNYYSKGDNVVMHEIGWRWGEFLVFTEDDNPPDLESGIDIFDCTYETEFLETYDGCWEDYDFDDCDEETQEYVEKFLEENGIYDLENEGWEIIETEMIIDCDLKITRINDDDTEGEVIYTGENPENEEYVASQNNKQPTELKLVPGAPWPFATGEPEDDTLKFKCESCDFSTDDIMELNENPDENSEGAFVCPKCGGKVDLE